MVLWATRSVSRDRLFSFGSAMLMAKGVVTLDLLVLSLGVGPETRPRHIAVRDRSGAVILGNGPKVNCLWRLHRSKGGSFRPVRLHERTVTGCYTLSLLVAEAIRSHIIADCETGEQTH